MGGLGGGGGMLVRPAETPRGPGFPPPRIRIRRADPSSPRDVASAAPVPPPPPPPPPPTPTPRRSHPRGITPLHCARSASAARFPATVFAPVAGAPVGRPDGGAVAHVAAAAVGSARIHRADASNQLACDTSDASDARTREDPVWRRDARRRPRRRPRAPRRPGGRRRPRVHECRRVVVVVVVAFVIVDTLYRPCTSNPVYTLLFLCLLLPRFSRGCDGGAPIDHRVADDFAARGGGGAREFVRRQRPPLAPRANQARRRRGG